MNATVARPFSKDDQVQITRPGCDARGTVGVIVDADHVGRFGTAPKTQWVKVEMLWPGSRTRRAYRFKDTDLALLPWQVSPPVRNRQPMR
jgi:hypothetical protein